MPDTAIVETVPILFYGYVFADKYDNKLYKVVKCNPAKVRALGMDGQIWNLHYGRTRNATEQEKARYAEWEASREQAQVSSPLLRLGHVVRFKDPQPGKLSQVGLFVVTKTNDAGYNLVRLGGELSSMYFRSVPGMFLERVDGVITVTNV